jgi:hypothetical protein
VVLQLGGLGEMLTAPYRKKLPSYESFNKSSDLDGLFGTTYVTEMEYETWGMEREEPV